MTVRGKTEKYETEKQNKTHEGKPIVCYVTATKKEHLLLIMLIFKIVNISLLINSC